MTEQQIQKQSLISDSVASEPSKFRLKLQNISKTTLSLVIIMATLLAGFIVMTVLYSHKNTQLNDNLDSIKNLNNQLNTLQNQYQVLYNEHARLVLKYIQLYDLNQILQTSVKISQQFADYSNITQLNLTSRSLNQDNISGLTILKLPNLAYLDLKNNTLKTDGVVSLIQEMNLNKIQYLDLSANQIEQLPSFRLDSLQVFGLANNNFPVTGLEYLAFSKLDNLLILDLSNNQLTSQQFGYLKGIKLPALNELLLNNNRLTNSAIKTLAQIKLPNLLNLNLANNLLDATTSQYLNTMHLQNIDLSNNQLGYLGIKYLAEDDQSQLVSILLANNNIGDTGMQYLATIQSFKNLDTLNLDSNSIGNPGMIDFSNINFPNLVMLSLSNNNITQVYDLKPSNLPNIESIYLSGNTLDEQSMKYLNTNFRGKVIF